MRVAIVNSFYQTGSPSGENQAVISQAEALESAGHSVKLVSQHSDDFDTNGVHYRAASAWRVATGRGASPEAQIAEFQPDIVHIHNLFPNWGYRWIEKISAPVVRSVHNYRPICAAGTLYRDGAPCDLCPTKNSLHGLAHKCYRGSFVATIPLAIATAQSFPDHYVSRNVARTIFLSEHQRQTYEDLSGKLESTAVVPNFVPDLGVLGRQNREVGGWCYVGRISEEKGVFDLVESWPQGIALAIHGDGPGREELLERLTDDIEYRGPIPNDRVHEVLSDHQGLVFPSKVAEVSPLTYMESLRAARPVVAFGANAAARDIRENGGRGGQVFDTWAELPGALDAVKNNVEARDDARAVYEEKFSVDAWLSAIHRVYESVLQERSLRG
jgi:glycosyltransferase involved in cell wall biosynthesis